MNLVRIKNRTKQTVNNSIERHPVPILGIDYKVKIIYKNIKIIKSLSPQFWHKMVIFYF